MNKSKIVSLDRIELTGFQEKMIQSGWGEEVLSRSDVKKLTYLSDGLKVKGYIAYPREREGPYPCIIWNRGGYRERGAIDSFSARGMYGLMASWGYCVLATQYRGNGGSEGREELGGKDLNDVLNLIPLADEFDEADSSRFGIEGWSRGGMMTFLALMRENRFKCAVLSGAISNIKQYADGDERLKNFYAELMNGQDVNKELKRRNVVTQVDKLPDIPYLIMHGGKDETIPVSQSIELAKKFSDRGLSYRLIVFEEGDHFLKSHRKEVDVIRKEWFDRYLKGE
jgi:dipeptidyl aminopeptidase/acylaminoacyl peptidase